MGLTIKLPKADGEYLLEQALLPGSDLKINASITSYRSKYYVAYRTNFMDDFNSKNYITELDANFEPSSHISISSEDNNTAFEDIRLFEYHDKLMALYTYLPKKNGKWVWENGIGIGEVDLQKKRLINQQSLREFANDKNEKNYVPLIHQDILYLVANLDPLLRIFKVNGLAGNFTFEEDPAANYLIKGWNYGQLRGGTPFIKKNKKDQWQYSFVHSSVYLPNGNFESRYYFYTVMRINLDNYKVQYYNRPIGYSKNDTAYDGAQPWILRSQKNLPIKVVFPMGIISHSDGLLISYGKDDLISRLKFYSWDYIEYLFTQNND